MMDVQKTRWRWRWILSGFVSSLIILVAATVTPVRAEDPKSKPGGVEKTDHAALEFFEKNVRPILASRCQGCHGPNKQKGGLRLDCACRDPQRWIDGTGNRARESQGEPARRRDQLRRNLSDAAQVEAS